MSTNFNLIQSLRSWFYPRDGDITLADGRKLVLTNANVEISGGNITITGTVDGVDISAHAADSDAHHTEVHSYASHSGSLSVSHDTDLTDVSADDHHNRQHAMDSASDHTGTLPWADLNKTGSDLADLATRDHDDLNSVGADDHHNESHNMASHSDTSATGSELNTLTDGSDASSLHDHDGRYFRESEFTDTPGSNSKPLESDGDGRLTLVYLDTVGSVTIGSSGVLKMEERGTPGTPPSGYGYAWFSTSGDFWVKNDAGTATNLTP